MSADLVLGNARVVAGGEVLHGSVCVRDGRIAAVDSDGAPSCVSLDLDGDYLISGLVELHTDNFERHMMPRPKVRWPELPALFGHDAEIAAAGITTVYDALGVGDIDPEAMRGQPMAPVVAAIDQAASQGLLRAEHRLHIRLELPAPNTRALFEPFAGHPLVGLISLMDHTPGQRQWTNIEQARIYYCGKKGWSDEKFARSVAESKELQEQNSVPNRRYFVDYCRAQGIPLASHDDTLPEHVEQAHGEGVAISEFPTCVEAAQAARGRDMAIVMGAPNVVRGGSHSGNVAAVDLARRGLLDALSSDYVPASLLMAAFRLTADAGFSIPQALATVSLNPARAAGLTDRGEIAPGLRADLVQVRLVGDQPVVRAVWREGQAGGLMETRPLHVLFLCSGNTARSIMAESILNAVGAGRFRGYSAGSQPTGVVSRFARELLQANRLPAEGLRSKSWDEFAAPGAPPIDFVITVCDQAAREACPVWPGRPMTAHWGIKDPAAAQGDVEMKQRAFFHAFNELQHRLRIFVSLPVERLDRPGLQEELDEIGRQRLVTTPA